jgi:hypothetical protein
LFTNNPNTLTILNEEVVVAPHTSQAEEVEEHHLAVVEEDIHSPFPFPSPSPSAEAAPQEIPSHQPSQAVVPSTEAVQTTSPQPITLEAEQEPDKPVQTAVAEQVVAFATAQQFSTPS